ncbi:MAG: hypothetical protein HY360_00235 [Verrucomicrobia bacterium]|nr:hypothetical protein [Verrucomicrobiota bacterium]
MPFIHKEKCFEFRRRLEQVHATNRRDPSVKPGHAEVLIETGWRIAISEQASPLVMNVARDLQDYLLVSMRVSVLLVQVPSLSQAVKNASRMILLGTKENLPALGRGLSVSRSYRIVCSAGGMVVCGCDERGVGQGSYFLEDLMNLREAPILKCQDVTRAPVFSPRMTHSGWGIDQFPDAHLNAMAHYGFDSILVFARGPDHCTMGYQDFNALADRAATHGLDVYLYSYLRSLKHPNDPEAEAYYESTYGALSKACPRAKGIVLVGESVEFPSQDEHTTGRPYDAPWKNGLPPTKPSPGWWPCRDYPQWLQMVKKAVRKHNPRAEIVFWTYNWGWAPEADRLALIRNLPKDITLLVTFEMFDPIRREDVTHVCVDYTIAFEGPGRYFETEARLAKKRGLRLYTMSNTGGMTWDFGVIPYVPVPFQWARRHTGLLKAHRQWGLSGLMESHHYGWWPSVVSELAKWAFWNPHMDAGKMAAAIARRDYGEMAAPLVQKAWQTWSEAIRDYIPTNEDQYGPFRVGPSYPMIFQPNLSRQFGAKDLKMPAAWHAWCGSRIVLTNYAPLDDPRQSPGSSRVDVEIRTLRRMADQWERGIELLEKSLKITPQRKRATGARLLNMARFMSRFITTAIHLKEWWKLNRQLMIERKSRKINRLLDQMARVAEREIRNAEETIPLVELDSRLGWEPSMEYMTDAEHLRWKIAQVRAVLDYEIPEYRRATDNNLIRQ